MAIQMAGEMGETAGQCCINAMHSKQHAKLSAFSRMVSPVQAMNVGDIVFGSHSVLRSTPITFQNDSYTACRVFRLSKTMGHSPLSASNNIFCSQITAGVIG